MLKNPSFAYKRLGKQRADKVEYAFFGYTAILANAVATCCNKSEAMRISLMLIFTLALLNHLQAFEYKFHSSALVEKHEKKKKAALILYGIPHHFAHIREAYERMLIKPNKQISHFFIFIHLYEDLTIYTDPRTGARNVSIQSKQDIQAILSKYPYPLQITTSRQSDFDKTLTWIKEEDEELFYDWSFNTIKNRFRADNSMVMAYRLALKSHVDFDLFFIARSDTLMVYGAKVPENWLAYDVMLPSWGGWPGYTRNDRFAITNKRGAEIYMSRHEAFRKYMRGMKTVGNSETMLKWWLEETNATVWEAEDRRWAGALRIRDNGKTPTMEIRELGLGSLSDGMKEIYAD